MGKGKRNRERRAKDRAAKDHTPLSSHSQQGKLLTPPALQLKNLQFRSWINDRLPEMLWGALIQECMGRENAIRAFQTVAREIRDAKQDHRLSDVTLTRIAAMPSEMRAGILRILCDPPEAREALRPLLLFPTLPAREDWMRALGAEPEEDAWDIVAQAVLPVMNHQSELATDLRWARCIAGVLGGQIKFVPKTEHVGREILAYPHVPNPEQVRPSIRAMELNIGNGPDGKAALASPWPRQFWDQCLAATACEPVTLPIRPALPATTLSRVREAQASLAAHAARTRTTTAVDARHEAVFGLGGYMLTTLEELLRLGTSTGILGRAGLRTLLESFLTLAYLAAKDDPKTWDAYRAYGTAQAKLAFLKLDELSDVDVNQLPSSVDVDLLSALANEDRSQEYVPINLGHWDAGNLRTMSERAGEKGRYDAYYGWTSGFVHGNWAAVRAVAYDLCANPLHRWHRVLRAGGAPLGDVVPDAVRMVDEALSIVSRLYPGSATNTVALPQTSS
jgi:hypothetical protein